MSRESNKVAPAPVRGEGRPKRSCSEKLHHPRKNGERFGWRRGEGNFLGTAGRNEPRVKKKIRISIENRLHKNPSGEFGMENQRRRCVACHPVRRGVGGYCLRKVMKEKLGGKKQLTWEVPLGDK